MEAVRDVIESTQGVSCCPGRCRTTALSHPLSSALIVLSPQDLGESVAVNESDDDSEEVGAMGAYGATKKKLEGQIKKIQTGLKKKKVGYHSVQPS